MGKIARQSNSFSIAARFGLLATFFLFVSSATPALSNTFLISKDPNYGDLIFGSILSGTVGTVTINPTDDSRSGNVSGIVLLSSSFHAANFRVTCSAPDGSDPCNSGSGYTIKPVDAIYLYNDSDSSKYMQVINFTVNKTNSTGNLSGGTDTFKVGATLKIETISQAPGSYSGLFSLTVHYQ